MDTCAIILRQLRVSKDVVFDEMSNWYSVEKVVWADLNENVVVKRVYVKCLRH